jgi:hypothetical protein
LEQFNRWVDNRERAEQLRRIIAAYAAKSLPWSAGEARGIPGMDRTGDAKGIHVPRGLGTQEFSELWNSIHVAPELKESLLCQSLLNFTLRPEVSRTDSPLSAAALIATIG